MSLRVKLAIAMVVLATGTTLVVGLVSYRSTRHELRTQIDASLRDAVVAYDVRSGGPGIPRRSDDGVRPQPRSFTQILVQLLDRSGGIVVEPRSGPLPVSPRDVRIAARGAAGARAFADVTVDGEDYRMLTVPTRVGAAQFARSLEETERVLERIRNRAVLIVVAAAGVALLLALVIAQQITRRLVRLTDAATAVAASGDLDTTVPVDGSDETGRLATAFNEMLASLARSRRAQHQLVQDAGHELRTPLTSLRTNVAVMRRFVELSPASQQRLLDDLESETRELSELVDELVQLATDRRDDEPVGTVSMGSLAAEVVETAVRRSGRSITLTADDSEVEARPAALERAMTNVVANAVKFTDGPVEVLVTDGRFEVLDRGPGIPDEDAPHVFDRFYRSVRDRSLPGSGLGLAIVREVAESHGGTVFAGAREGGGSRIGFAVPLRGSRHAGASAVWPAPSTPSTPSTP